MTQMPDELFKARSGALLRLLGLVVALGLFGALVVCLSLLGTLG